MDAAGDIDVLATVAGPANPSRPACRRKYLADLGSSDAWAVSSGPEHKWRAPACTMYRGVSF